jgi:hypothetical protein
MLVLSGNWVPQRAAPFSVGGSPGRKLLEKVLEVDFELRRAGLSVVDDARDL